MKLTVILLLLFSLAMAASAQDPCGTHQWYQNEMKTNPEFRMKQAQLKTRNPSNIPYEGVVTIPVVVHVVYNNEEENVSDEQIYSQLEVLNEDLRLLNTNIDTFWSDVIADAEIEFCLATQDDNGNAHCGITRTYTDSTEFRIQTSVKDESTGGISGWDAQKYMNLFVCDISNLLGYATFPDAEDSIDGIVIDYLAFGRGEGFNLLPGHQDGRVGTHEVGHWLRLSHIWGDGGCDIDDGISDTPNADGPNIGCNFGSLACSGDSLDMVQNYMDYSDDTCMYLFTQEQVNLMRTNFSSMGSRAKIVSSKGCQPPAQNWIYFKLTFDEFPEDITWELRDSSNTIIASDGNFEPGDPSMGIPSPLANATLTYEFDFPDGDYTLSFYDSFGDGFPEGGYEIKTVFGDVVISGPGNFTTELTIPFTLENAKYRFTGPGVEWESPGNWNRKSVPSECYEGDIIIESNCEADSISLSENRNIIIRNNAQLSVRQP